MDFDPHTLHQIIQKIQQQMRCPQCGKQVPVDLDAVELTGNDFVLLKIRCETCDAYIVLHASLQGVKMASHEDENRFLLNASSQMSAESMDTKSISDAVKESGGSFQKMFGEVKQEDDREVKKKEE
ncbi:hypothetical protein COU77_00565 [Candidatus Peregrinibacteria bacterium CG10_big_fil_rev_8_21_14_0_10_49_16]|nr:MAG: hypothetical protein COW95_01715 [Candidatus Peregrinibacteria bacterium CG22_combo_CG10-13_8_21_14_all_49_11]PIR52390.1 MAG: hypothetical protein COU77_00565 [Candidatus Peregrinibacteria bacterium CG10_big_fil_rev_8_21_14_0_10_49_16]